MSTFDENKSIKDLVKPITEELLKRFSGPQNEALSKSLDKSLESFSKKFIDKLEKSNALKKDNSEKKSELEEINGPRTFIFGGIDDKGFRDLSKKLPEILKDFISTKKIKEPEKDPKKGGTGLGMAALGGLAIVGGLLTLLAGLTDTGPLKGLAKLVGKGAIEIGKFLLKPLTSFIGNALKFVMGIPKRLLKNVQSFFKIGEKAVAGKVAQKAGGSFLSKFLGGALKFFKKVPIIGSLISIGFAWNRFKNGDIVGGGIEVLSGIAGLFPGIGTAISIGLDALNAFLDIKAGGSDAKASGKKLDLLKDFFGSIGEFLRKNCYEWPVIGPLIKSYDAFDAGDWKKGLKFLAYAVPGVDFIAALLGDKDASQVTQNAAAVTKDVFGSLGEWITQNCYDWPIVGNLVKAFQAFDKGQWIEGFKQLGYAIPGFEVIGALFGDKNTSPLAQKAAGGLANIGDKIGSFFGDILKSFAAWFVNLLPESIGWGKFKINIRSKVAGWLGVPMNGSTADSTGTPAASVQMDAKGSNGVVDVSGSIESVKDGVIDPHGGLLLSSPKLGGLGIQIDKKDGVVAAPMKNEEIQTNANNNGLMESLLQTIATNTGGTNQNIVNLIRGFNDLTSALQKTIGKDLGVSKVIPVNMNTQKVPTSSQIAQQGNLDIYNFRKTVVEQNRFQPA